MRGGRSDTTFDAWRLWDATSAKWREGQEDFLGKTVYADEQRRVDVAAARRHWQDTLPVHDADGYVFLDETGVTTDLLRRYGRSPRGARLHDYTPCGHWQTHT